MPASSKLRIIVDASTDAAKAELGAIAKDLKAAGAATSELAATQHQLAKAVYDAEGAARKLADAQVALAENTDPAKQEKLEGAVLDAQVALDREAAEVDQLTAQLQELDPATQAAREEQARLAEESDSSSLSFTELNSAIGVVKQGMQLLESGYNAVITPTLTLAENTRNLARTIGSTPQEASRLIAAADDMAISYETLTGALEAAIRKGFQPNIQGLGELSEEYLAIQDPIERSRYLMDTFGRSGADLAALMEKGADGIDALGRSADETGQVIDERTVRAARELELATDDLQDSVSGLAIGLSVQAIPALTTFAHALSGATKEAIILNKAQELGLIGSFAAWRMSVNLTYDRAEAFEELARAVAEAEAAQEREAADSRQEIERIRQMHRNMQLASAATYDAARAADAYSARLQGLADSMGMVEGSGRNMHLDRFTEASSAMLLSAGQAGSVADAWATWRDVIAETNPEVAKLTDELARYEAANGRTFTVTKEATVSLAEYELAQLKAATAAQKLAEYTGDSREEELELQVAVESAAERVANMGEQMGITREFTADYTKKIQETAGSLDALIAKQDGAAEAVRKATRELIFQQATAGLSEEQALKLAFQMGMIEEQDYKTALAVQNVRDRFDENEDAMIDAGEAAKGYTTDIGLLDRATQTLIGQQQAGKITQDEYNAMLGELAVAAGISRDALQEVIDRILGMPSEKTITITTRYVTEGDPTPAMGEDPNWEVGTPVVGPDDTEVDGRMAGGGPVRVGGTYWVGEHGPEPFIPAIDGRILSRSDALAVLRASSGEHVEIQTPGQKMAGQDGGWVINVDARGAADPAAVEAAGYRGAQRALREAGYRDDARRRTGARFGDL